jgi:hypothetical protein
MAFGVVVLSLVMVAISLTIHHHLVLGVVVTVK